VNYFALLPPVRDVLHTGRDEVSKSGKAQMFLRMHEESIALVKENV
jgi:hypothetical protein